MLASLSRLRGRSICRSTTTIHRHVKKSTLVQFRDEPPPPSVLSERRMESTSDSQEDQTKETTETKKETICDNPCWGTPEKCSLADLLEQIQKSRAILYETPDYIALDKPADLRMDGEFPATVHKLLTYWFPPPSLKRIKDEKSNKEWLDEIAKYHRHSDHPDNELRPCHQLDYATSGVLLVARTKEAANHAVKCFENRQTQKVYLALLHGKVKISDDWPTLEASFVDDFMASQEDAFRRSRRKRRPETFQGYQPPHALYQQWQQHALNKKPRKSKKKKSKLSNDQWERVWETLGADKCNPPLDPSLDWNHIKKIKETERFQRAADLYNQILVSNHNQQQQESSVALVEQTLPTLFRIKGEQDNSFYICAPLGEVEGEFSMRLPPSLADLVQPPLKVGPNDIVYRPALTKCEVVCPSTHGPHAFTKVRLIPRTGRRHQLRVHTSLAGHAIVGDCTYEETNDARGLFHRMCLHSHELELKLKLNDAQPLYIQAPDPW